jgi:hypothetical protein
MPRRLFTGFVFLSVCSAVAAEPFRDAEFDQKVQPLVERYGMGCHDTATAGGDFDLESFLAPAPPTPGASSAR